MRQRFATRQRELLLVVQDRSHTRESRDLVAALVNSTYFEDRGRLEPGVDPGTVFVPFHYAKQAANELTITAWDPVSKQPMFKLAAVRATRIEA